MMEPVNVRNDVSILLNFTETVFEKADPLMGLVNAGSPLLFYDRLSVGKFSGRPEEREEYIDNLISDMRNLLETRSLSQKDLNGRIRLIVAIDLAKGICPPSEKASLCFPAQNAKYFKDRIAKAFSVETFDEENRLLNRFCYCFIFLDSSTDTQKIPRLYRESAFLGHCNMSDVDWITNSILTAFAKSIEKLRAEFLSEVKHDENHNNRDLVPQFLQKFKTLLDNTKSNPTTPSIPSLLHKVGLYEKFLERLESRLNDIRTIAELKKIDFVKEIQSIITLLLGIGSELFLDSTFFLLRVNTSTKREKIKSEIFFKSLVQLASSISDSDYHTKFLPPPAQHSPWYYTLDVANNPKPESFVYKNALNQLSCYAEECLNKLMDLDWSKKDKKISYTHYERKVNNSKESDTYTPLNEKIEEERNKKRKAFVDSKKIPFFFGQYPGDWDWYNDVLAKAYDLYRFEKENGKPLYDSHKRITNGEMTETKKECSYNDLHEEWENLKKETVDTIPMENFKQYQENRHKEMDQFAKAIEELKTELVKLGFLSRLLWISVISSLVFTLCFAFHFFYNDFENHPIWIAAGLAGISLLFVFGSLIAQAVVKSKIRSAYNKIDHSYNNLQKLLDDFLKQVHDRKNKQDMADITKRNLDEMNSKLSEFEFHQKKVELWSKHFSDIDEKIKDFNILFDTENDNEILTDTNTLNFSENDFHLSLFPFIPLKIRNKFNSMKTSFTDSSINQVTCFVNQFNFKRFPR